MDQPLVRTSLIFTSALVGGVVSPLAGVPLPLDKLVEGLFAQHDANQRKKLQAFGHSMAEELAVIGPKDEGTRTAVCLTIETAIQRFPISHRRLVELNLDPDKATAELAPRLAFAAPSDRTELEDWCKRLIRCFYEKLPRHAHILGEMLPDLWAVSLQRQEEHGKKLDNLQELVATMAANDAERRALQAEVNALRADGHMLDRAIITLLQDVGERIGDPNAYPDQLRRAGERYRELLAEAERPRNLPAAFEAVRQEAAALIREGRLADADARLQALRDDMAAWRADQQTMLEEAKRDEASVLAERAGIAKTRLRYRDAATLLAEAADLTAFDPETSWRHRLAQGNVLHDLGREFGDNATLTEAIATYEQALALVPRNTCPDDWATTQISLADALRNLGERENNTTTLWRSVEVYQETRYEVMLRGITRPTWARWKHNLAAALTALCERESGRANFETVIAELQSQLTLWARKRSPYNWAAVKNNLGVALTGLGEQESGTATLKRAVKALEAALLERTRERVPLDWAETQNNVGLALGTLGARERGTHALDRAVEAYQAALLERTRKRVPYYWAQTQEGLATVRLEIGRRRGDTGELRAALVAVDGALEVYWAGKAEFYIEKAERLRARILAALAELDG